MKNWIQKLELHILSVEIIVFENPLLHKIIHYFFNLSHIRRKKCNDELLDLVEDAGIAESMFSDYTKRGYRGIYIFAGSPHFFPKKALFIVMDGRPLKETAEKIMRILQEERAIILLDGNFLYVEDQNEALKFLCLIKDYVFVNGSCMILFLKSNLERWHGFLERELVKIG